MEEKKQIQPAQMSRILSPISHAVACGRLVVTSAEAGKRADGTLPESVEEQMELAFGNLEQVLQAAGGNLSSVVRCDCFLTKAEHMQALNTAYRKYFQQAEVPPARSTLLVGFTTPGMYVEISAIAVL